MTGNEFLFCHFRPTDCTPNGLGCSRLFSSFQFPTDSWRDVTVRSRHLVPPVTRTTSVERPLAGVPRGRFLGARRSPRLTPPSALSPCPDDRTGILRYFVSFRIRIVQKSSARSVVVR